MRIREILPALNEHLYRAQLIVYGSLLIVGVFQIVIRERFPEVHPPWPLIVGALMVVLFGVVLVPPLLLLIAFERSRMRRNLNGAANAPTMNPASGQE